MSNLENLFSTMVPDNKTELLVNCSFKPSKTAQNGLNFITKEDEAHLASMYKDPSAEIHEDIITIFKVIYILIKQKQDKTVPHLIIDNLINNIMPKYKIENLSKNFF